MSDHQTPQGRDVVEPIVSGHLAGFARVLEDAWQAYADACSFRGSRMGYAKAAARAMLISDFTVEPAHRVFAALPGVWVDDRFGRPWVNLAEGSVQVRFRALDSALGLCRSDTDRALRLNYHLGDPVLPDLAPATILTAGYVMDASGLAIERMALVCHLGSEVHYSIAIPSSAADAAVVEEGCGDPVQLPLMPLTPPIIRSAQSAALERLSAANALGEVGGA